MFYPHDFLHRLKRTGKLASLLILIGLPALGARPAPVSVGKTEIARWPGGHRAALSLTFDDGTINQFRVAVPILDKLGLTATFHVITGEIRGSRYRSTFLGRAREDIVRETAGAPTNAANFRERATAIGRLGLRGALDFQTRAGELFEEGKTVEAYTLIDEGFARVRRGEFAPEPVPFGSETGEEDGLSWDELKALASRGHEISSHTVSHPYLAVFDDANLDYELDKSRQDILDHLGPAQAFTIECPYGTEDPRVVARALRFYPASRNHLPDPFLDQLNRWNDKAPSACTGEYVQWQRGVLTATPLDLMRSWVETTAQGENIWLVLVFHGVDGIGWEPRTGPELDDYFRFIKSHESAVWVTTFRDAVRYMRERMASRVRVLQAGPSIRLSVSHALDPAVYDLPLSLKTYVPSAWPEVEVRQGRRTVRLTPRTDGQGSYVLYEAQPNAEGVEIRPVGGDTSKARRPLSGSNGRPRLGPRSV